MSTAPRARQGEFTGRHMWLLAIAFFGVIIGVNVTMAVVASTSWTGLVVPNSYVASQEFETKRLAHTAQAGAGWVARLDFVDGAAILDVTDDTGLAVDLGQPVLQVNRPVGGHDDQRVTLERRPDGRYAAAITLEAGVWEARVSAPETALGPFELHERIRVPELAP